LLREWKLLATLITALGKNRTSARAFGVLRGSQRLFEHRQSRQVFGATGRTLARNDSTEGKHAQWDAVRVRSRPHTFPRCPLVKRGSQ
jgi:hypothetical protein